MTNAQTGFADINGVKMYYEVAGQGFPVVFVHAGIADSRLWDEQFAAFAQKYKVVRFDMRGYGKTEPVDGEFGFRDDILALLDHLGVEKAHFIGCSMGGGMSMDIALNQPERVASVTMVCSGPTGLNLDVEVPPEEAELEAAEEAKDWDKMLELETRIWVDGVDRRPEDVDPVFRAKAREMNQIALQHAAKGLGKNRGAPKPYAAERLHELTQPVLAVIGVYDEPYILAAGDYMVATIKNCRKHMIQNSAHLPSLEQPAEFNQVVLDFLTGVDE